MRAMLVSVLIGLAGCASQSPDRRDTFFQSYLSALDGEVQAGKRKPSEAASLARAKASELFNDPYMDELWAYRVTLAQQVEKGEMTPEQAQYLDQQKVNQVAERQRPGAFRPIYPRSTTCKPDGYGGVRCQ